MSDPFFSVLLPVYNAEAHIARALRDLLNQTFRDFEIVVIDDGSSDRTNEVITRFSDPRIRLFPLPRNQGLVEALNIGLEKARGSWIARQDADDRCRKNRLARQHEAISLHSDAVLHYSRARLINEWGWWRGTLRPPTSDSGLRWDLCFRNAVPHTSVVFPTQLVREELSGYRGDNVTADYDLWSRLLRKGAAIGERECLVSYRNHSGSIMGRENIAAFQNSKKGLSEILAGNLREWAHASEEEAGIIAAAWLDPVNTNWDHYFMIREKLTACGLAPDSTLLAEEDYTLMHLAFGVSWKCGAAMLEALRDVAPIRSACLPQPRTFLSRQLARWR